MYRDCLFNCCISFGHLGGPVATEIHLLKKNTHSPVTILSKIASCHGESLARSAISEAFETQFVCETCALDPFALLLQHLGLLLGVSKGTFKSSNPKGTSLNHPTPGVLGCVTKKPVKNAHSVQHLSNHISNVQWLYRIYLYPSTNWPKIIDKQFQLEECHSCHSLENKLISAGRYWAKPNAPLDRGWIETCDFWWMSDPARKLNSK